MQAEAKNAFLTAEKGAQTIALSEEKLYNIKSYPEICINLEKGKPSEDKTETGRKACSAEVTGPVHKKA